jgi:aminoglycoside phosphotransferase (APT) family kinase protein
VDEAGHGATADGSVNQTSPDPVAVLAGLGLVGPSRITPVSGGADAAIWRVGYGDADYALRLLRADQAAMARRETVVMAAAAAAGIPVPRVLAEGSWDNRPALLLSWMPGRLLRDELERRPWRAWALGVEFGRIQAAIHAVPVPVALHRHPVSWIEWAEPDAALRDRLRRSGDGEVLLHLDYHPANVLVEGGRVSAVLDWANARAGDRRADLARTAAILRFAPLAGDPSLVTVIARRAFVAGWRHGYRGMAGAVTGMAPFYAWAAAVMRHDLAPRVGRTDLPWLTPALLAEIRRWGDGWWASANRDGLSGMADRSRGGAGRDATR